MANTNTPPHLTTHTPIVVDTSGQSGPGNPSNAAPLPPLEITKYQFRKLFSISERIAIDNVQYSTLPGAVKATIATLEKDIEVSAVIDIHSADVIGGVNYLVSVGMITSARAARILANLPPQ